MLLDIYRESSVLATVPAEPNSEIRHTLMGEDTAHLTFRTSSVVTLQIGDYITVFGKTYYLNLLPMVRKISSILFQYDCVFESVLYDIGKVQFMLDGQGDFYLNGNADTFIDLLISNLNRVFSGWTKGTVIPTDYRNLYFSAENCLSVLQRLADQYDTEFYLNGKQVNFTPLESNPGITIEYGKSRGAYEMSRKSVSSKNIVTRLYAFGSERNIPSDYRSYSPRLKLGTTYLESNVALYGVVEHTEIFDDIFPHYSGTVTGLGATELVFADSGIGFDINDQLLAGLAAKVHFNSGDLAGYEFEFTFDYAIKTYTLIRNMDEKDYDLPNATIKPGVGDSYTLLDLNMPQSYIDTAEAELLSAAQAYIASNSVPRVVYTVLPDRLHLQKNSITFNLGGLIHVIDSDLGIDGNIRIIGLTRKVGDGLESYNYTIELAEERQSSYIQQVFSEVENIRRIIRTSRLKDVSGLKRNWLGTQELLNMIYDIDGYFDVDNFKANSIETNMLSVGTKSGQFALSGVVLQPNYQGDKSKLEISGGYLIHYTLEETPKTWTLTSSSHTDLVDGTAYYIYARVNRADAAGTTILSTDIYPADYGSTYYWFLLGVLHSVVDNVRDISLTYGHTRINGRYITTGRITSSNGSTYFDLDDGEISGTIIFSSGSSDSEVEALIQAKRRVFTSTPSPPYDVGDLWVQGTSGDLLRCYTGKTEGQSYSPGDWVVAVKYTDDTTADTKSRTFIQTSAPVSGMVAGDYWLDSDDSYKPYVYRGGSWVLDTAQSTAQGAASAASTAQSTADTATGLANTAQSTANLKARIFVQTSAPTSGMQTGDYWLDSDDGYKVYVYRGGSWNLDAAQALAASKKRHFTSQPATPYEEGDTWTDGVDLRVCVNTRLTGSYYSPDWDLATGYDGTKTVIDGGLVTTGRIEVGNSTLGSNNAGVNGSGTAGTDIRFWAGNTYANRASAPFRVQNDGSVVMTKATIQSAATGKRIVIDGTYNRMDFINSAGNLGVRIDDTLTQEYPGVGCYKPDGNTQYRTEMTYYGITGYAANAVNWYLYAPTSALTSFYLKYLPSHSNYSGDWGYVMVRPSTGEIYRNTG